jgi:hypothetical protein
MAASLIHPLIVIDAGKRTLPWLLLDVQALLALAHPGAFPYLRWLLLAFYMVVSAAFLWQCSEHRWVLSIVGDRETRVVHGLEHATIAVLREQGFPVLHGLTHARDRFVIALPDGHEHLLLAVGLAADAASARVRAAEHSLCYDPNCGTSALVAALSFWLMLTFVGCGSWALDASVEVTFAVTIMLGHVRYALETPLGLLAQRLYTVSTSFTSARVADARVLRTSNSFFHPEETRVEIVIEVHHATHGGLVIPGLG